MKLRWLLVLLRSWPRPPPGVVSAGASDCRGERRLLLLLLLLLLLATVLLAERVAIGVNALLAERVAIGWGSRIRRGAPLLLVPVLPAQDIRAGGNGEGQMAPRWKRQVALGVCGRGLQRLGRCGP